MPALPQKLPSAAYRQLVGLGEIDEDKAQIRVLERLDALCQTLAALPSRKSGLGWLFHRKPQMPKGLYLYGSVGRGKTMLMDLMIEAAPLSRKKRVHYQAFMADVHERVHRFRAKVKNGEVKDGDPVPPIADDIARETQLLCLDEFSVNDIADAMILARLFTALFDKGLVLVATSNLAPDRLYEGGLNRALFLPFIETLKANSEVVELDSLTDYRLEKTAGGAAYIVPADDKARASLDAIFHDLLGHANAHPMTLTVKGHSVHVPLAGHGVARFTYDDLCKAALGSLDFLEIAKTFRALVIDNIPIIHAENRNEAKRFIALIDALYDQSVKLYASATALPQDLYKAESGREAFEFDRTASRLIEMQSDEYRALPHGERLVGSQ